MPKAQETVLEINLSALGHNYNYLKSKVNTSVKLMAVVKAFGYGSDSVMVAKELQTLGADYFAVAYTSEGVRLRDENITTPILSLLIFIMSCLEAACLAFSQGRLTGFPKHLGA